MPDVALEINGQPFRVTDGTTVAAALLLAGVPGRISVTGEARFPLCGMGTCYECRAIVDGVSHARTCQLTCQNGMQVRTEC